VVTMKDVARAAGVSQAAVSYAFSNSPKVSASQRDHIYAVAQSLSYAGPNIVGSSLRSGRVGAVGIMVMESLGHALEDPSTMLLMKGVVEVNELADVALTLLPLVSSREEGFNSPAVRGLVDGVVLHNVTPTHPIIAALIHSGTPAVAIDSPADCGLPFIGIDDRAAGFKQMAHLLDLGHRRIGVVCERLNIGGTDGSISKTVVEHSSERVQRDRILGYFDAATARGDAGVSIEVYEASGIDRDSGVRAVRSMVEKLNPTAIATTSDVFAVAALSVLRSMNIPVPEVVSVVGFDDAPIAELMDLTTVRQPLVEKGRAAASMLLDNIDGAKRRQKIFKTKLIVRNSTGPVSTV
jgi:DNA-binding LacI/PurR family transcriptional regulator